MAAFDWSTAQLVSSPSTSNSNNSSGSTQTQSSSTQSTPSTSSQGNSSFDWSTAQLVSNPQSNQQQTDQNLLQPAPDTSTQSFVPSPLDPAQRALVAFPRTMAGKMKEIQNLGIDPKSIGVDSDNNITIAGKPINPAIHGLWDFLRDSMGQVAQGSVNSLPLIGQIGADLAATSSGVGIGGLAAANAAGSAGGEAVREGVANALTGEKPSGADIGLQAGLGAITPPLAMGMGKAIQTTKQVLLNGMAKIAGSGRADKFVAVAAQVLRNTPPDQVQFAIDTIRQRGADSILNPAVADENYAINFVKNNFFGDDIAKTVQEMATKSPQVVRSLYNGVLGMPLKDVETMMEQGPAIYRMRNPEAMAQLAENISKGISDPKTGNGLLNQAGKELGDARLNLIKKAGGIDAQGLTETNTPLFQRLVNLGMLKQESNGGFSIVKDWAGGLNTGKQQQKIFGDYLNRFARQENFTTGGLTQEAVDAAQKASASNIGRGTLKTTSNPLGDLLASAGKGGKNITTYFPDNKMNYKKFAGKLGAFDTALSGNEFDAVGKMAPDLQQAVKGLRNVTMNVAQQVGDDNVPRLTKQFSQLAEDLGPLKQLVESGNKSDIQSYLTKISEEKDLSIQSANWSKLNDILKPKGINMLDDLNAFSASNFATKLNTDEGKMKPLTSAQHLFDKAWEKNSVNDYIRTKVDPYLPRSMKIIDNGKVHVVAKELDKDARSLLKARFISAGVLGMAGINMGGPIGGAAGLAGGFMAQNPEVLKGLLRFAASRGTGVAAKAGETTVSRPLVATGLQQLKKMNSK